MMMEDLRTDLGRRADEEAEAARHEPSLLTGYDATMPPDIKEMAARHKMTTLAEVVWSNAVKAGMKEAAARIEALEKENARLREMLPTTFKDGMTVPEMCKMWGEPAALARLAILAKTEGEKLLDKANEAFSEASLLAQSARRLWSMEMARSSVDVGGEQ